MCECRRGVLTGVLIVGAAVPPTQSAHLGVQRLPAAAGLALGAAPRLVLGHLRHAAGAARPPSLNLLPSLPSLLFPSSLPCPPAWLPGCSASQLQAVECKPRTERALYCTVLHCSPARPRPARRAGSCGLHGSARGALGGCGQEGLKASRSSSRGSSLANPQRRSSCCSHRAPRGPAEQRGQIL